MSLTQGSRLGPYEVLSALGAGGMGEVYRARDTKLGRDVALKVLPESLAADPERLARLHREAQVLASLNHPHIAAIYGLEDSGDTHALVMELVEGETLADRIARGPIPIDEALPIAKQIAEALEAAHEQGIIHRDLKPANIKVRDDGAVKVLDFGLAKLTESAGSGQQAAGSAHLSMSPTITTPAMTGVGILMGTATYMAPEQAKGKPADKRSDIWAFGCVLYEMLTGTRPFEGDDVSDTLAAVLRAEPEWDALPGDVPSIIRTLVQRCLAKDRRQRIADISTAQFLLTEAAAFGSPASTPAPIAVAPTPPWKRVVPVAVATALLGVLLASAAWWSLQPSSQPLGVTRFAFSLPKDEGFTRTGRHVVTISPDGSNIVYVAKLQLNLKPMTDMQAHPIPGTAQDVNTPFFSPDGRWVAFYAVPAKKLKKIALTGGADVTICDLDNPYGATWYSSDQIMIGLGPKGIVRVSANGGTPETVIRVKPDEYAQTPQVLPGGDNVLFTLATGTAADRWDKAQVVVQSLRTGQRTVLISGGSDARYVPTGHIVYALGSNLFAVPFDAQKLRITGGPVPIAEGIMRSPPGNTAASFFTFAGNGTFTAIPGSSQDNGRILALVDATGAKKPLGLTPASFSSPRISPDGKQLAVTIDDGKESDIWIYDLSGTTSMRRLTFGGVANLEPAWTRDSQRIVFQSDRDGTRDLYWQRADGSDSAERLTMPAKDENHYATSWSPDGKTLAFTTSNGGGDIWVSAVGGDKKPKPLIAVEGSSQTMASFSPDGR